LNTPNLRGDIPKGNYGAGSRRYLGSSEHFEIEGNESAPEQVERGDLKLRLRGERLNGRYVLVKMAEFFQRETNGFLFAKAILCELDGDADAKQERPTKAGQLAYNKQTIPDWLV